MPISRLSTICFRNCVRSASTFAENVRIILLNENSSRQQIELVRLEKLCGQGEAMFTYDVDENSPDLRHAKFDESVTLVAENMSDGRLVGCVTGNVRKARFGDEYINVSYACGMRVHPNYRRSGLADQLQSELELILHKKKMVEFNFLIVEKSNEASLKLVIDKLKFKRMFDHRWFCIDIKKMAQRFAGKCAEVKKLGLEESRKLLHRNCRNNLLFPENPEMLISNLYSKPLNSSGSECIALNVYPYITNFIFPDKTSGNIVKTTWYNAFPFIVNMHDVEISSNDFRNLLQAVCYDLRIVGDVLVVPSGKFSNINSPNLVRLLEEAVSDSLHQLWTDVIFGKAITPDFQRGHHLEVTAMNSSNWFLDGREL